MGKGAEGRKAWVFGRRLRGLPTTLTVSMAGLKAMPDPTGIGRNAVDSADRSNGYVRRKRRQQPASRPSKNCALLAKPTASLL